VALESLEEGFQNAVEDNKTWAEQCAPFIGAAGKEAPIQWCPESRKAHWVEHTQRRSHQYDSHACTPATVNLGGVSFDFERAMPLGSTSHDILIIGDSIDAQFYLSLAEALVLLSSSMTGLFDFKERMMMVTARTRGGGTISYCRFNGEYSPTNLRIGFKKLSNVDLCKTHTQKSSFHIVTMSNRPPYADTNKDVAIDLTHVDESFRPRAIFLVTTPVNNNCDLRKANYMNYKLATIASNPTRTKYGAQVFMLDHARIVHSFIERNGQTLYPGLCAGFREKGGCLSRLEESKFVWPDFLTEAERSKSNYKFLRSSFQTMTSAVCHKSLNAAGFQGKKKQSKEKLLHQAECASVGNRSGDVHPWTFGFPLVDGMHFCEPLIGPELVIDFAQNINLLWKNKKQKKKSKTVKGQGL
jgi:hypothetical protein